MPSSTLPTGRITFLLWTVLAVIIIPASLLDCSLSFVSPLRMTHIVWGALPFLIIGVLGTVLVRRGFRYAVFLVPVLVTLLICELVVSVWFHSFADRSLKSKFLPSAQLSSDLGRQSLYVPHHYSLYALRPELHLEDGLQHNDAGFRDERDFIAEDNALRIVFVGGSTTYTVGIRDNQKIYTRKLERALQSEYAERLAGRKLQVINAGLPGATSAENLLRFIFFVSELKPDLLVVQQGLNDIYPRVRGEIQSDYGNYRKSWSAPSLCNQRRPLTNIFMQWVTDRSFFLSFLARTLGYAGSHAAFGGFNINSLVSHAVDTSQLENLKRNPPKYFERNTRSLIRLAKAQSVRLLLVSEHYTQKVLPIRRSGMPEHNEILKRVAAEESTYFLDLARRMIDHSDYMPDGRHVNQAGSDYKAQQFFEYFQQQEIIPALLIEKTKSEQEE